MSKVKEEQGRGAVSKQSSDNGEQLCSDAVRQESNKAVTEQDRGTVRQWGSEAMEPEDYGTMRAMRQGCIEAAGQSGSMPVGQ